MGSSPNTDAPTLLHDNRNNVQGPAAGEEDVKERRDAPAVLEAALSEEALILWRKSRDPCVHWPHARQGPQIKALTASGDGLVWLR